VSTDELLKLLSLLLKMVAGALLFGVILRTLSAQERQRKKALALFKQTRQPPGPGGVFLVRYVARDNFEARSKVIAGDGFGLLSVAPSAVVFRGELSGGTALELTFLHQEAAASWVGRRWTNGFFSWFVIIRGGERHYFTSASGFGVLRSKSRTRRVYDEVAESLA
jgi:hypothetical protein